MFGVQLCGVLKARRRKHFGQRFEGVGVELEHPLSFVGHHQGALAKRVLGGNTGWAFVGVAALRLNAANREHKAACRVGPVGTNGQHAGNIVGADDFAAGPELDLVAQVEADQGVVHKQQAFAHRCADVVGELYGGGAGTAFFAVNHDEVRQDAGFEHGLADPHELPRVAQAELEAHRFAARQLTQLRDEVHHFDGR